MRLRPHLLLCVLAGSFAAPTTAWANQPGMGGMGPGAGGPPGGPGPRKDKKDGPAEEAPKDKEALRPIEAVPAQPAGKRRLQLFELHGYIRTRGDYFHRLNMDLRSTRPGDDLYGTGGFFYPPAETDEDNPDSSVDAPSLKNNDATCQARLQTQGVPADKQITRCQRRNGFASANMRLRLEPTLHVTDTVKVHAQIDALDNLVLGSTPDSYGWDNPFAPIDMYTRTQTPPTSGINSFTDSIVVKRAYGHIKFGFGLDLQFGRMGRHWGLGIVQNDGNGYARNETADIVRMVDTDYGDNVDSIRFAFDFGKDRRKTHTLAFSWDWANSGPTTSQVLGPQWSSGGRVGQEFSVEKFDNVYQWTLSLERRDDPDMLRRKLSLDDTVFNYGVMGIMRYQDVSRALGSPGLGDGLGTNGSYYDEAQDPDQSTGGGDPLSNGDLDDDGNTGFINYASSLVHRRALLFTPDLWMRVNWRTLRVELEAAGQFGRFYIRDLTGDPSNEALISSAVATDKTTVASFGYALEFKYGLFDDRFHIGFDHGFASGDTSQAQDFNYQNPLTAEINDAGNQSFNAFRMNPAYTQDLLLFREVLGTISNAAYFKPWAAFHFFDNNFSARVDVMYALAMRPQATLGDRFSYGIELNGAGRYHDQQEPIFFQLQYGVLFPLPAFNRLPADGQIGGPEDAKAVQSVQAQIGIKF